LKIPPGFKRQVHETEEDETTKGLMITARKEEDEEEEHHHHTEEETGANSKISYNELINFLDE